MQWIFEKEEIVRRKGPGRESVKGKSYRVEVTNSYLETFQGYCDPISNVLSHFTT